MQSIHLDRLKEGFPAISKNTGAYLAEAGAYCLKAQGHASGVRLDMAGNFDTPLRVVWTDMLDDQVFRTWADSQEATEFGAVAIASMLIHTLTDYTFIERSFKGTGFDYWLGKGEYNENLLPFEQRKARLEVSGIWRESPRNTVLARMELKKRQISKSDSGKFPALIIVVEFGTPKSNIYQQ